MFRDLRHALNLFRDLPRVLDQLRNIEQRLKGLRLEGKAGGDLVRVVIDGTGTALDVQIDPMLLQQDDPSLLQELLKTAITEANHALIEQARAVTQSALTEAMMSGISPTNPEENEENR